MAVSIPIRMTFNLNWRGNEFEERVKKVAAGALKAGAKASERQAKEDVDVVTGTLQRSIHVTNNPNEGDRTEEAKLHDLGSGPTPEPAKQKGQLALWVMANTFYAIYEELLHPYLHPSMRTAGNAMEQYIVANRVK